VDYAFKKVFATKENSVALIGLLNAILNTPNQIVSVRLENPFNNKDFLEDKLTVLDIRATDENNFIYNVEMQISLSKSLPRRMVFYSAELFARQLKEGDKYDILKPVFTIAIVDGKLIKGNKIHHNFRFIDKESGIELEDTIQIHMIELGKYTKLSKEKLKSASKLIMWIHWFLFAAKMTRQELLETFPEEDIQIASKALIAIATKKEDKKMYDMQLRSRRDYASDISEAKNEGIVEGEQKGKMVGIMEGEKKGKIEGKIEERVQNIHKIQKSFGLPLTPKSKIVAMSEEQFTVFFSQLIEKN
jgi:predicted transposase/invertase (TIGR01784 family)